MYISCVVSTKYFTVYEDAANLAFWNTELLPLLLGTVPTWPKDACMVSVLSCFWDHPFLGISSHFMILTNPISLCCIVSHFLLEGVVFLAWIPPHEEPCFCWIPAIDSTFPQDDTAGEPLGCS